MSLRDLRLEGVAEIEREVAVYRIAPKRDDLPMVFRVKVVERPDGSFVAYPEIALKGADGQPDWTSGMGPTVEQALADCVTALFETIRGKEPLTDDSIEWSARF